MRQSFDDFRVRTADDPSSLLIVILDTSIAAWIRATGKPSPEALTGAVESMQSVTEQLLVFVNTFLLFHENNRVAVIVSSPRTTKIVYPTFPHSDSVGATSISAFEDSLLDGAASESSGHDNVSDPDEESRILRDCVARGVKRSIQTQEEQRDIASGLSVTTAFSTALCLFNRARRIRSSRAALNPGATQDQGDAFDKGKPSNGRILHILASHDDPRQYVPIMNCIFSAQRIGVLIDTCMLADQDSTYFQQAAHLTRGVYVKPHGFSPNGPDVLTQVLHSIFLIDKQSRDFLAMPTPEKVDFRASCLQTKKIIDHGYTCSVCLSTFDVTMSKVAICPICNARYTPSSQRRQPRRS